MPKRRHRLSSTQVDLPSWLASTVVRWGHDHIPDRLLYDEPGYGREDHIHVTVCYGLTGHTLSQVAKVCEAHGRFEITLGRIGLFTTDDRYDVVKIEVESDALHRLNRDIRDNVSHVSTHPTYQPHVTVAYARKGACYHLGGLDHFEGKTFQVKSVIFSDPDRRQTAIPLDH